MTTAFVKYGNYSHPTGEVNLVSVEAKNVHNGRGQQREVLFTYFLRGEICITGSQTTADITQRIVDISNAYSVEGRDFGLYLDSTTISAHNLRNGDPNNISGVRILQRPSFPEGGAVEYATGRTFTIVLQALYASPESQIQLYREFIEFFGNGGPVIDVWNTVNGPQFYQRFPSSFQRIIQRGSSVGYNGYAEPFGPLFPAYEHGDLRVWSRGTPQCRGNQFTDWPMEWSYTMSSPVAQDGVPNFI